VLGTQESHCVESGVAAKKWLDDRLMAKINNDNIYDQVNLVPIANPSEVWTKHT